MDIILNNKYKIQNLNQGVTLSEALDGIAYTTNVKLIQTEELRKLNIKKGDSIKLIDTNLETKKNIIIFNGIVWEKNLSHKSKELSFACKERTIYTEKSEDEYLFPAGMTATQRIQRYCRDWGIPIASLVNTKIKLAKAVYSDTILGMIIKDLKETAQKGGNLYKLRMLDKLNIIQLGSNKTVWKLETIAQDIQEKSSLEGVVTQVKVLGKEQKNKKTPVIGVYKKETNRYGTIQKLVKDDKVKNAKQGKKRAETLFNTGEESVRISCSKDINTIRAGDKVSLNGAFLYVIDITHNLESTGNMNMNLGTLDYIRRHFYSGSI